MGEADSECTPSRKRKQKLENTEISPEKKAKDFCCLTFRQELKGNDALKSLKKFISAAKNSDNVIYDYMENGGSLRELFSLLDPTATGDLTTALPVFEALHLIFLRFQSSDSEYHEECTESARIILRSYLLIIKAMLSMNVAKQKKVALKVLTAIATLDSSFAIEIMNVIALSPALITALIQPSPEKESVRKCFVLFVLSFLIEGNLTIIKSLLEKKGFLSSIIPGLKFDEASTVNLTLSLFEEKILRNIKIPKTLKLKMFNTQIIKSLFDLYDWKGLQGIKQILPMKKNKPVKEVEINQSDKEVVTESVHSFLMLLCCSHKFGVAFQDKSLGTSEELSNQLLLTVFESLPDPLKNKKVSEVMLKTIVCCPDLMKPILLKLEPSFQPRNSKNWFQAMEFAENLIKAIDAVGILKRESESVTTNHIIKVGKALCAPAALLKFVKLGSQKTQIMEIRLRSLTLLTTIWNEMQRLFLAFPNYKDDFKNSLYKHIYKGLLESEDLIELWYTLCDAEFFEGLPFSVEKRILFLSAVLESLHIITQCQKDAVSSPLSLASNLLDRIETIKECINQREFDDLRVKIIQFVDIDFETVTSNMGLFEKSLVILFRSINESSLSYLSNFLTSLDIFKKNKSEVDVWLLSFLSLPMECRSSVADFLVQSMLLFFKEVTEGEEKMEEDFRGESEKDSQTLEESSLTPLLSYCVEMFKSFKSKNDDQELQPIRHYLNDVIIHLQHFYVFDIYFYDQLKDVKSLGKSILRYLKGWKNHSARPPESDVIFCPLELDLISWLVNEEKTRSVENIIDMEKTNLLKVYSLFRIVVAYLNIKIVSKTLSRDDVEKFTEALSLFLHNGPEDDRVKVDLISLDIKNKAVYQRHCLDCLFRNKYLLNSFDVFQEHENDISCATDIILKVLMEKDIVKTVSIKKLLTEPWKLKFLKQLKMKLKNKKSIDGLNNLEKVLNFFEYDHQEVAEVLELFMSVSKLDLFIHKNAPSTWIAILSEFIELHCQKEELNGVIIKKLCNIMEHLRGRQCSKMEKLENCFVDLLRKHPSHLLLIDNEFLDVILLASNTTTTTTTVTLGKLLLNDPRKVTHFLNFIAKNLENLEEPQIVYHLIATLIVNEESLFNIIKLNNGRSVWKISEINPTDTPDVFNALETVYKKFEKNILRALEVKEGEFVLKNVTFTRELIKLFLDKKEMKKLKKDILKGKFDPELLFEAVNKINVSEVTENYLRGLLVLFCQIIEKSKDMEIVWERYCAIVSDVIELNKESSWQSVVSAPEWKKFTKLALGHCLSFMSYSSLLKILRLLITAFYKSKQLEDCGFFFQMLISHSQFLKVILSDSPLKIELVQLYWCLIERSPSEMTSKHFPILLASYNAGLSPCDRILLQILRFYEVNKVEISNYEPFVWGNPAVSHYSIGTNSGLSLWQRFTMANVLDLLDGQRLELSLKEFPIHRKLEGNQDIDWNSNAYDPAFLLPLFANLLSPGAVVFCLPFIYKGGLAYTVRALSSECKDIRALASVVLTRFYNHLELSQKLKQKLVWMHFINCFRYGIKNLTAEPLPNIITLFFARMSLELTSHPAEIYLPLQNYLLAKSYFTFEAVPEFLPMFHSSQVPHRKYRLWLLEVIRDATKTASDMKIVFHSMILKVLFCFFFSQLSDNETKKTILQAVERMLRIDKSILLISEYGLLDWITAIDSGFFETILHDLLNLLNTLTGIILKDIQIYKSKHSNSWHLIQILNLMIKLLPSLKLVKSVEDFKMYLKILNDCFKSFTKQEKSDWFKLHKNRVLDIVDAGVVILGENYNYGKFCKIPFYFRDFDGDSGCEELKNSIFLFNVLSRQANEGNKKL